LGDRHHRILVPALPRRRDGRCDALDGRGREEAPGKPGHACRIRALPEGHLHPATRVGGEVLRRTTLEGDAAGRSLRRARGTAAPRRGAPHVLPAPAPRAPVVRPTLPALRPRAPSLNPASGHPDPACGPTRWPPLMRPPEGRLRSCRGLPG